MKMLTLVDQTTRVIDIKLERALLIKELEQVEDLSLLRALRAVLHYGMKNEGRISIEQYNRELDEAEARVESGEFFTNEEFKKMAKKW